MRRVMLAAAAAVALAGCTTPLVKLEMFDAQRKATRAAGWEKMAEDTVAAIPANIEAPQTVYVEPGPPDVVFAHVFKQQLEEKLVANHFMVLTRPDRADVVISFDATLLLYDDAGKKLYEYASLYTGVGSAAALLRHADEVGEGIAIGMGAGLLLDIANALNGTTKAEVVLTSKLTSPRSDWYHMVKSDPIYIRKSDVLKYTSPPLPPPTLPVVPLRVTAR